MGASQFSAQHAQHAELAGPWDTPDARSCTIGEYSTRVQHKWCSLPKVVDYEGLLAGRDMAGLPPAGGINARGSPGHQVRPAPQPTQGALRSPRVAWRGATVDRSRPIASGETAQRLAPSTISLPPPAAAPCGSHPPSQDRTHLPPTHSLRRPLRCSCPTAGRMVLVLTGATDRSAPAAVCFPRMVVEVSSDGCALTATPLPAAAPLRYWGRVSARLLLKSITTGSRLCTACLLPLWCR